MKRFFIFALSALLLFGMIAPCAYAEEINLVGQDVKEVAKSGDLLIVISELRASSSGIKSGSITYTKSGSSGSTIWTAILSASFTYDGTSSSCTAANLNISISSSNCYEISRSVSRSGNTATATFTIGYEILGVTYNTENYTITLSCDKDGNLS